MTMFLSVDPQKMTRERIFPAVAPWKWSFSMVGGEGASQSGEFPCGISAEFRGGCRAAVLCVHRSIKSSSSKESVRSSKDKSSDISLWGYGEGEGTLSNINDECFHSGQTGRTRYF